MLQRAKEVSCNNLYQRKRPTLIKEKRGTKEKREKEKKGKKENKKKNRHALYAMNKKKHATHCPALLCLLLIHMGSCLSDMTLA